MSEDRLATAEMLLAVARKYLGEEHKELIDKYFNLYYGSFEKFQSNIRDKAGSFGWKD